MHPDSDLTILLPLKDRVPFTRRWMSYHSRVRLPYDVCVLDGGTDDTAAEVLADRAAFPGVNYEYVRCPRDAGYRDYWTKIASALSRIRTPMVVLADNDDLFLVRGLRQAAQFMTEHPDYASCGGQCAIFWVAPEDRDLESGIRDSELLYGPSVEWKCSLDQRSLTEDSAGDRIRHHSPRATHPAYYHVRRTAVFRRQAEILRDLDLADPFLIERLLFFLGASAGKAKQLETLYVARQWNAPGRDGLSHEARHGDWLGRMLTPTWSADFARFVDAAAAALAAADGLTKEEARRSAIELYRLWLAPQMLGDILAEPTVTVSMPIVVGMVRRLLERSPDNLIRRSARLLYRRSRWISPDAIHGTQVRARRVPRADEAFKPIYEFLTSASRS